MKDNFQSCLKWLLIHFIPNPGHTQSIQTGPGTSLCSCSGLSLPSSPNSLFLLTIQKQDEEFLSAPCPYCICQAGVSSRSVCKMQTQDCFTWSWSCKSWIFYGSFTVRLSPSLVWSGLVTHLNDCPSQEQGCISWIFPISKYDSYRRTDRETMTMT